MKVNEAVRELRGRLGLSQQAFATKLGVSIRAIANYEKDRQPDTRAAFALALLARDARYSDLMLEFWECIEDELGVSLDFGKAGQFTLLASDESREDQLVESLLIDAVTSACRRPEFSEIKTQVIHQLTPVVQYLTTELNDQELWKRFLEVTRKAVPNERNNNKTPDKDGS